MTMLGKCWRYCILAVVIAAAAALFWKFRFERTDDRATVTPSQAPARTTARHARGVPVSPDEAIVWERINLIREQAMKGDDVDHLDEFRALLGTDHALGAAIRQIGRKPYREPEIMLLRVLATEAAQRVDSAMLVEWLNWYDETPEGLGKRQMTTPLMEIRNREVLDMLAFEVLPKRVDATAGDASLIYHAARGLIQADPEAYFHPVMKAASEGSGYSKDVLAEAVLESGGFNYERSMKILDGTYSFGSDPRISNAAIYGLASAADERAKNQLFGYYRDSSSPHQDASFEALRMMHSETPGIFTDEERAEIKGGRDGDE